MSDPTAAVSKSKSPGKVFHTLRQLWPFVRRERTRLLWAATVTLGLTLAGVATPILVGLFIDSLVSRTNWRFGGAKLSPGLLLSLLGFSALLRGWLTTRQRDLSGQIGERVAARLRDRLWRHLQVLPLQYTRARGPGQLLLRFISDTRAVQRIVTEGLVRSSQDLFLGLAILVVLGVINLRMGLAVAVVLPLYAVIFRTLNPALQQTSRATRRRRSRLSSYLSERIMGMAVLKSFAKEPQETESVKELNRDLARRAERRARVEGQLQGWTTAALGGIVVLVLWLAAREVSSGRLTAGALFAFYSLLGLLHTILQRFVTVNRYFQEGQISVERLMTTLAEKPEAPEDDPRPRLKITEGEIVLRSVSLQLRGKRFLLEGINLQAQRGALSAVLGPIGSGKTTVLELLPGFHQPSSGSIEIDGQNIANVSLSSLRSCIGLVGRDAPLFNGSVRENIAYGLPGEASEEQLQRAAELAGADEFIAKLRDGWNSAVGRGGSRLSAGQRQRVALARALAIDPPILVLDDALAGLDAKAERSLLQTLQTLAKTKTVIVSAHRLPAGLQTGSVLILDHGRSVDSLPPGPLSLPGPQTPDLPMDDAELSDDED